jgi:hypothetical protein
VTESNTRWSWMIIAEIPSRYLPGLFHGMQAAAPVCLNFSLVFKGIRLQCMIP